MVARREPDRGADRKRESSESKQHRTDRVLRAPARNPCKRRAKGFVRAPRKQRKDAKRGKPPSEQAARQSRNRAPRHVTRPLRIGVRQLHATELEPRIVAHDLAVALERFLAKSEPGERARIGAFLRAGDRPEHEVERGARLDCPNARAGLRIGRAGAPVVQRVGERAQQEKAENHRGNRGGRPLQREPPVGAQLRGTQHIADVARSGDDQRKQEPVGQQEDRLHAAHLIAAGSAGRPSYS